MLGESRREAIMTVGSLMFRNLGLQGNGNGHHDDRSAERRQNVVAPCVSGKTPAALVVHSFSTGQPRRGIDLLMRCIQGGEFTME